MRNILFVASSFSPSLSLSLSLSLLFPLISFSLSLALYLPFFFLSVCLAVAIFSSFANDSFPTDRLTDGARRRHNSSR